MDSEAHTTADVGHDIDLPLIEAIAAGDQRALDDLMQRHQEPLFHFVLRYLANETTARDVVQETFVRVFFKADAFRPRSTVKTWIYSIALNQCRDLARKRGRTPAMVSINQPVRDDQSPHEIADTTATPDVETDDADRFARLREAIDQLPDRLKSALILCALEQRSHKEAAEILGTTPKTVELRIYRAKAKLRAWLSANERAPSGGSIWNTSPA